MSKNNSPLIIRDSLSRTSKNKIKAPTSSELSVSAFAEKKDDSLEDWQDKIYSIAILLTGCADDAQQVVDEVMQALQAESSEHNETLETRVHRLAYDSSLVKLLGQVDAKTSKLEEASNNILTASNFLS